MGKNSEAYLRWKNKNNQGQHVPFLKSIESSFVPEPGVHYKLVLHRKQRRKYMNCFGKITNADFLRIIQANSSFDFTDSKTKEDIKAEMLVRLILDLEGREAYGLSIPQMIEKIKNYSE